jgi:Bacterial PH domain
VVSVSRYPSKVDWWLGALLVLVPLVALGAAVAQTVTGDLVDAIVGWLILGGVVLLYVCIVWPVAYELHADAIVIRFGLVRSRIPYASIRAVRPSRSMLASPALSLDRLAIDTGGRLEPTISPANRAAFLDDLVARAPHLQRDGDRLTS